MKRSTIGTLVRSAFLVLAIAITMMYSSARLEADSGLGQDRIGDVAHSGGPLVPGDLFGAMTLFSRFGNDDLQRAWLLFVPKTWMGQESPVVFSCRLCDETSNTVTVCDGGFSQHINWLNTGRVFFLGQDLWGELGAYPAAPLPSQPHRFRVQYGPSPGYQLRQGTGAGDLATWLVVIPGFGPTRVSPAVSHCSITVTNGSSTYIKNDGMNRHPIFTNRHTPFWSAYLIAFTGDGSVVGLPAYPEGSAAEQVYVVPCPTGHGM